MKDDVKQPAEVTDQKVAEAPTRQTSLSGKTETMKVENSESDQTSTNTPNEPKDLKPASSQLQASPPAQKSKNQHLVPIILALLILIGLAGIAIKAGMDSDSKSSNSKQTNSSQTLNNSPQSDAQKEQASINDQAGEIDSLNNDNDDSGDGLSDQNLGL